MAGKEKDNDIEKCNNQDRPTILVCIDTASSASKTALKYACLKAARLGFTVQIMSVIEPSHKNLLFGSRYIGKEKRGRMEESLKKLIADSNINITPVISIKEGDIATEITKEIKSNPCCIMVILGKSNNSSSDNTVLPKMAQKIGRKIPVPITIVPENINEKLFEMLA